LFAHNTTTMPKPKLSELVQRFVEVAHKHGLNDVSEFKRGMVGTNFGCQPEFYVKITASTKYAKIYYKRYMGSDGGGSTPELWTRRPLNFEAWLEHTITYNEVDWYTVLEAEGDVDQMLEMYDSLCAAIKSCMRPSV